jgi:hypothetical protein
MSGLGTRGSRWLGALAALAAVGCAGPTISTRVAPPHALLATEGEPHVRLTLDEVAREVVVDLGPFDVPAMEPGNASSHGHGAMAGAAPGTHGEASPLMPFAWPIDGWLQGFQVRVTDGQGRELPRHVLHHMIGVNFDRRQLAYPIPERFFGIGTETADVALPSSLGVPMAEGQQLALYASWHNDTGHDLGPVYVRVAMDYTSREGGADVTDVLPAYFDTDYVVGGDNTWDVPPGRSERAWDFTVPVSGGLLGVTGHLHDFGHHVRLEDAETGEVLVRLDGQRDEEGRLLAVETRFFRKWLGLRSDPLRLLAGHRYRVVGVYDNPGDETIADGAMAHIVGVFSPDDVAAWPTLDKQSELVELDLISLPARMGDGHAEHHHR